MILLRELFGAGVGKGRSEELPLPVIFYCRDGAEARVRGCDGVGGLVGFSKDANARAVTIGHLRFVTSCPSKSHEENGYVFPAAVFALKQICEIFVSFETGNLLFGKLTGIDAGIANLGSTVIIKRSEFLIGRQLVGDVFAKFGNAFGFPKPAPGLLGKGLADALPVIEIGGRRNEKNCGANFRTRGHIGFFFEGRDVCELTIVEIVVVFFQSGEIDPALGYDGCALVKSGENSEKGLSSGHIIRDIQFNVSVVGFGLKSVVVFDNGTNFERRKTKGKRVVAGIISTKNISGKKRVFFDRNNGAVGFDDAGHDIIRSNVVILPVVFDVDFIVPTQAFLRVDFDSDVLFNIAYVVRSVFFDLFEAIENFRVGLGVDFGGGRREVGRVDGEPLKFGRVKHGGTEKREEKQQEGKAFHLAEI